MTNETLVLVQCRGEIRRCIQALRWNLCNKTQRLHCVGLPGTALRCVDGGEVSLSVSRDRLS